MSSHIREWHWFDWIFVSTRTIFFLFFIMSMQTGTESFIAFKGYPYWLSLEELPHNLTLYWLLATFVISHFFWNPKLVQLQYAYWAEIAILIILFILCITIDLRFAHLLPLYCLHLGFISIRKKMIWSLLLISLFVCIIGVLQTEVSLSDYLVFGFYCFTSFGYAYVFQRMVASEQRTKKLLAENKKQYRLIQEKNTALVQYTKQIENMTIIEERNRMASELHDTIGHTFTSVIMGMDAVIYLIESSPEKAKEKLEVLRELMSNGLDETRQNIHQIADEKTSSLSIHTTLIANEFSRHTGTETQIEIEGSEYEVTKPIRFAIIRCLQESLTNAKRHGQAMKIQIKLHFLPTQIQLTVSDDGAGAEIIKFGFGLTTMKERLQSLHGNLQIHTEKQQGMTIVCTLPTEGGIEHETVDRR